MLLWLTFFAVFASIMLQIGTVIFYIFIGRSYMSRRCDICGKGTQSGNSVSKSYNHTRRTWKPNLVEIKTEIGGTTMTLKLCTRCLRSGYVTKKV